MRIEELKIDITDLLNGFVSEERELLEVDISEQAISSKLGRNLESVSQEWNVDCEYNRDQSVYQDIEMRIV